MTMASTTEIKSWKEINKAKKEKRKKWQEEKMMKKVKKEAEAETETAKEVEMKEAPVIKPASTISIAVPGSILDNAQSPELRTYLAGQIARAACMFNIDEIVVFDDYGLTIDSKKTEIQDEEGLKSVRHCCLQLARILQYLECPQYLRKYFFPIHSDLSYAGVLNPLDTPHHLRQKDEFLFREGVVTKKPVREGRGSFVNVGLLQDVVVDKVLNPGLRVTVKLKTRPGEGKKLHGEVVPPSQPRNETGTYWGYTVRYAHTLAEIFSKSPYKNGYNVTIGTSDRGASIDDTPSIKYKHALVVFGGLHGLEAALDNDESLTASEPSELFDYYLNTLPAQGSRTIRTEEAIIVSMAALRTKLQPKHRPVQRPPEITDHSDRFI